MKYLISLLLISISLMGFTQGYGEDPSTYNKSKLDIDRVDDMTGKIEKRTVWNKLIFKSTTYYYRFSKIDSLLFFELKTMRFSVFAIDAGPVLLLKFNNEKVITYNNLSYTISERGGGAIGISGSDAQGVHLYFPIDKNNLKYFTENLIIKLRLNTTKGYVEAEVNNNRAENLVEDAKLMLLEGFR